jgi:hypothetical protein
VAADETRTYEKREREREPRDQRQVSMPVATVGALLSAMLAGGGGSYLTGSSITTTMREGQIRLEAQVTALRDDVRRVADDQRAALSRLEGRDQAIDERVRVLELDAARRNGATPGGPR